MRDRDVIVLADDPRVRELAALTALLAASPGWSADEKDYALETRGRSLGLEIDGMPGVMLAALVQAEIRRLPDDLQAIAGLAKARVHRIK